jgi:hypothetical protein
MSYACVIGTGMSGSVPHHAGHIIGWTGGEYPSPIYCSGHSVTGNDDTAGQDKMTIEGKLAVVVGGSGPSTDPCDGSRFENTEGCSFMTVQGKPLVLTGHHVSLYPGDGTMISANQVKFVVLR